MPNYNNDLIEPVENIILSPAEFTEWVKEQNPEDQEEFIGNPVTVVNKYGDEVSGLPGGWRAVDTFQSGKVMYRRK